MRPKRVIIVGATSGIGWELASIYAREGHKVAITGRREQLLEKLQQQFPDQIIYSCFDVTGAENVKSIEEIVKRLGGLDLLIYNSGVGEASKTLDFDVERRTTLTNVNGFVEIVNYAFNYFLRQGHGQIALTSSVAAYRGNSWAPAYSASKAFMSNYAEGLNIKSARLKSDIVVTDIKPGFVDTKMAQGNKRFWTAGVTKAAQQIFRAIEKKKRVAHVTRRWRLVAVLLQLLPYSVYKHLG